MERVGEGEADQPARVEGEPVLGREVGAYGAYFGSSHGAVCLFQCGLWAVGS